MVATKREMGFVVDAEQQLELAKIAAAVVTSTLTVRGWQFESVTAEGVAIFRRSCERNRDFYRTTDEQWKEIQRQLAKRAAKKGIVATDYVVVLEEETSTAAATTEHICSSCGCDNEMTVGTTCFVCAAPLAVSDEKETLRKLIASVKIAVAALEKFLTQ